MQKQIRTGVYALMLKDDKILVAKKGRGPFTGIYDLPGGKIEHYETHIEALKREILEETGLKENEFEIEKLLTVEENFVTHICEGEEKQDHIIAVVYLVKILTQNINFNHLDDEGDARGLKCINLDDESTHKTDILQKAILKFKNI